MAKDYRTLRLYGVDIVVINDPAATVTDKEIGAYIERGSKKFPLNKIVGIEIKIDGGWVELNYKLQPQKFERIRRITGYLTSTVDKWNNAKQAEERDRVKHGVSDVAVDKEEK